MSTPLHEGLEAAVHSVASESDPEVAWTRAEVARRLFHREDAPTTIGRFEVVRFVGAGAMGRVFLAHDTDLERPVAIKLLGRRKNDESRQRLLREAKALAKLSHPNVVHVYEAGTHDDAPFIAMEFLEGQTLREWQTSAERGTTAILDAYLQAGRGLLAAHREGLVHRDFKPDNAFVRDDAGTLRVRVIDFGLALLTDRDDIVSSRDDPNPDLRLTQTAALLGTPLYMAPEVISGHAATVHSDQFSFCVGLAEALWGAHPFPADSLERLRAAQRQAPNVPNGAKGGAALRAAIVRGLAEEPNARHESLAPLLDALERSLAGGSRRAWFLGGSAAVAAVAGVFAFTGQPEPCSGSEEAIADTWSATRRSAIASAFDTITVPHAAATGARVTEALDGFANAWVEGHHDACLASSVRREQSPTVMDMRMRCLDQARRALDTTARVFETQTGDVVDQADRILLQLPSVSSCADLGALEQQGPAPTEAQREQAERAQALAVESVALRIAGSPRALDLAGQAQALAEGSGYAPARVEAQLALGLAQDDAGEIDAALKTLAAAHALAAREGLEPLATRIVAERYGIVGRQGSFEAADALEPLLFGASRTTEQRADALLKRGLTASMRGDPESALTDFNAALEEHLRTNDALAAVKARKGIAVTLAQLGRFEEAIAEARRGVAALVSLVGAVHPKTADMQAYLADMLRMAGQLDEAETVAREALSTMETVRGPDHPEVADLRRTLGGVLLDAGRPGEALAALERAAHDLEAALGDSLMTASAYSDLGGVYSDLERLDASAEALEKAAAIQRKILGDQHPDTARTRDNLGSVLAALGRFEEAEREIRAALKVREATLGPEHPELATSYTNLGAMFEERGDFANAEPHYATAARLSVASEGPTHPNTAHVQANHGRMLTELGRPTQAIPLLEAAVATQHDVLGPDSAHTVHTRTALGRALCRAGRTQEGRAQLRDAIETAARDTALQKYRDDAKALLPGC